MKLIIINKGENSCFLYELYNNARKDGLKDFKEDIPEYIINNLKSSLSHIKI